MKARESGMPAEDMWQEFFSPAETLDALGLGQQVIHAAEFGCGYGTFTIPAARMIAGTVHAFDIEPEMITTTGRKAQLAGLSNIQLHLCDFIKDGTGLAEASVEFAMLFNILHAENPAILLSESFRILHKGGVLAIMHWNYDDQTPRGPSLAIRPKPEQCADWAEDAGFTIQTRYINLPPYHYGIVAQKRDPYSPGNGFPDSHR